MPWIRIGAPAVLWESGSWETWAGVRFGKSLWCFLGKGSGGVVEGLTRRLVVAMPCVPAGGKVMMMDVISSQPVLEYFVIEEATVGALRWLGGWRW